MAVSLYDLSVRGFLQTVGAVEGFLAKGLAWCGEKGMDPETIVETRLIEDMAPFRFQVLQVCHHSLGAIEGIRAGVFSPTRDMALVDYAGLQRRVTEVREGLAALQPTEIDALEFKDVVFQMRDMRMPFTAERFLLSFSLPNLHFHAATAYDILRMKGAPLGKRDFMGALWLKG